MSATSILRLALVVACVTAAWPDMLTGLAFGVSFIVYVALLGRCLR